MATRVPSLDPNYPDTDTSIDNTGDVVEVHFACLRGYFDDWFVDTTWPLRGQEYMAAALSFTSTMRLIQVLTATLRTGYLKYRQCHVNKMPDSAFGHAWNTASCSRKAQLLDVLLAILTTRRWK